MFFSNSLELLTDDFDAVCGKYESNIIEQNITPIDLNYSRKGECSINPAYQNSASINQNLKVGEKKIWALREDFILAVGVKNAYQSEFSYHGFESTFDENINLSDSLNLSDRFGHPSLTLNEYDQQLKVYYAGYLSKNSNGLGIFLASGRYFRNDLTLEQISLLESYISLLFQKAYGSQEVTFYCGMRSYEEYASDADYYSHLGLFFNESKDLTCKALENEPSRHYSPSIF